MKRITLALSIIALGFALSALSINAVADAGLCLIQSADVGAGSVRLSAPVKPGTQLILEGPTALTTETVTAGVGATALDGSSTDAVDTLVSPPLKYAHPSGTPVAAN
jgi:hypothetical protein